MRKLAVLTVALGLTAASTLAHAQQPAPRDHALLNLARARQIALARVPANEGIKSEKLKTRAGIQVYEFDIETPGAGHREVRVDAHTGAIVADKHEDDLIGGTARKVEKATDKAAAKVARTTDKVFSDDDVKTAKVRISETRARAIALRQVPNGKIKDSDLETENGYLIWEVEVDTPGKGHEEVIIDAQTGVVLSQRHKS
jgi:uncharacterized membrane protein YkoI